MTVTSEDATNGHQTADCEVTLKFVTVDETVIHPESVQMGQQQVKFDLQATKEGDINSAVKTRTGFDPVQLSCTVLPDCSSDALHTPYNREVIWVRIGYGCGKYFPDRSSGTESKCTVD